MCRDRRYAGQPSPFLGITPLSLLLVLALMRWREGRQLTGGVAVAGGFALQYVPPAVTLPLFLFLHAIGILVWVAGVRLARGQEW